MEKRVLGIINLIRESNNISPLKELRPNDNLRNDLGFSSFDLAELTVRIEDEFDVDIFADGLVLTVGEILKKVNEQSLSNR